MPEKIHVKVTVPPCGDAQLSRLRAWWLEHKLMKHYDHAICFTVEVGERRQITMPSRGTPMGLLAGINSIISHEYSRVGPDSATAVRGL